jgi:pyruvate/2-oxoglutarate dehydrogenase complex dihydrolipoamide acyltransferase (E2) component
MMGVMVAFRPLRKVSSWRKVSLHTWGPPSDPSVYGALEIDVTRALAFIDATRRETGVRVTLTHLVGKAAALAVAERPDVNAVVRRGRHIYLRDQVDVFFMVAFEGGENLSGAKVERADQKGVADIARELEEGARRVRELRDRELKRTGNLLKLTPGPLVGPAMRFITYLTYDLGLDLRSLGLPFDQFGSVMVTNIGTFGIAQGFVPLLPFARAPLMLAIGAVQDRPVAIDGRVEVRPVLSVGATFDHRLLDGYQAGRLAKRFQEALERPDEVLGSAGGPAPAKGTPP